MRCDSCRAQAPAAIQVRWFHIFAPLNTKWPETICVKVSLYPGKSCPHRSMSAIHNVRNDINPALLSILFDCHTSDTETLQAIANLASTAYMHPLWQSVSQIPILSMGSLPSQIILHIAVTGVKCIPSINFFVKRAQPGTYSWPLEISAHPIVIA